MRHRASSTLFPYTTLFRSSLYQPPLAQSSTRGEPHSTSTTCNRRQRENTDRGIGIRHCRSEEHTSELQSQSNLVCRLLLEKKKHAPRRVPVAERAVSRKGS